MKTKPANVRPSSEQEDWLLIHAHVRGIKRRTTMAQIAFDMGMDKLRAEAMANGRTVESAEGLGWEK